MLQRIQTLYLSVTFVLTVLLFFLPMANFQVNGDLYSFTALGLEKSWLMVHHRRMWHIRLQ
jgi:hypothetical protein